jgi:hypothetical protein
MRWHSIGLGQTSWRRLLRDFGGRRGRAAAVGLVAHIADAVVPFVVLDDSGQPVEPVRRFLPELVARGRRPGSVRSYAYALLRWWLIVIDVEWDQASSVEVREFVLWMQHTTSSEVISPGRRH